MYAYTCARTKAGTNSNTHTHTHTHTRTHTHTHTCRHEYTHTHTHTYRHEHTHTHNCRLKGGDELNTHIPSSQPVLLTEAQINTNVSPTAAFPLSPTAAFPLSPTAAFPLPEVQRLQNRMALKHAYKSVIKRRPTAPCPEGHAGAYPCTGEDSEFSQPSEAQFGNIDYNRCAVYVCMFICMLCVYVRTYNLLTALTIIGALCMCSHVYVYAIHSADTIRFTVYKYVCMCVYVFVCVCMCVYVIQSADTIRFTVYEYVCMCVYIFVCVCMCVYVIQQSADTIRFTV
jgi:hypothetical protein